MKPYLWLAAVALVIGAAAGYYFGYDIGAEGAQNVVA